MISVCKNILLPLVVLSALLGLPGCKDLQEVDALNIVLALGIDQTSDHQILVTAEIVDPSSAQGQGPTGGGGQRTQATFLREQTGTTIEKALDKFDENVARNIFLPHNTVVVFGKSYAEHGIDEAMDYLERNRNFRRNQLFVVTDSTANELLKASGKPEFYNASAIRALVEQGVNKSVAVNSTQLSVMRQYLRPSHAPNLAYVTLVNSRLCQCGIGLFDGGQYKGHIVSQDAQALLLFIQDTQQTEITLPCPGSDSVQSDLGNTFRILNTHTHVVPVVRGNDIQFLLRVRGRAEIERLCPGSKPTEKTYTKWESELDSDIQTRMQRILEYLQTENLDSVDFANVLFENQPEVWRQIANRWKSVFPNVKVHYDIQIQLLRHGLSSQSPDVDYSPKGLPPLAGRGGKIS